MSGKLEQLHDHIIGCRVVIEMPHKSQKARGNQPDVHIVVRVPGKEIVVSKELAHEGHKKNATDAYAVLDNAFAVARSRLKDYRRILHGDVKYKSGVARRCKCSCCSRIAALNNAICRRWMGTSRPSLRR